MEVDRKLREGEMGQLPGKPRQSHETPLDSLRKERDAMNGLLKELRDAQKPAKSDAARELKQAETLLKAAEEKVNNAQKGRPTTRPERATVDRQKLAAIKERVKALNELVSNLKSSRTMPLQGQNCTAIFTRRCKLNAVAAFKVKIAFQQFDRSRSVLRSFWKQG